VFLEKKCLPNGLIFISLLIHFFAMGKNKKNRQKQQQNVNPAHQIPIITATTTFDDSPDADNLPEQVTVHSPVIFVETVCI
jgi:hypothetical protein